MKQTTLHPADRLRESSTAMLPDPRTVTWAAPEPPSLAAHHAGVAAIQINSTVPEPVAIQFENARNLYLYAWYVYRFYMPATVAALAALEFGLRERLRTTLSEKPLGKKPMLKGLLSMAVGQGLVRDEGFRRWHHAAQVSARERLSMEALKAMIDNELTVMEYRIPEILEVLPEDQQWDLAGGLPDSLPAIRNELAHGSSMLTNQVLGTIELVAEILNQLYPEPLMPESSDQLS
ncbi:hypothetical protein [Acidovorax sp. HMWF018]|uniref:hypothetical protein n=1 Tax=Acidovorax sp. HMWF018 TaxID=2056855 RepID=UPI001E4BBA83|nr:hypothetical protein [Acidovorax sp. HMWF018]